MTEKYYKPKIDKPKQLDTEKYEGVLSKFIDTANGSIKVKLEHEVIVERISHNIYTSWASGVRELLNNELKACRTAKKKGKTPRVNIYVNQNDRQLIIHGVDSMGMTPDRFGEVVAWLGRSSNHDRSEAGMFGMGIASYTTLSDSMKMEIYDDETKEKYAVMGRNGHEWLPLNEIPDLKHTGCRLTLTLNDDIDKSKNYNKLIEIIHDVGCQKEIPITITLTDNTEDDDEDYDEDTTVRDGHTKGTHEVVLCDRIGYLKQRLLRKEGDWNYYRPDVHGGHYLEVNTPMYDIVLAWCSDNNRFNSDIAELDRRYITLLDTPIESSEGEFDYINEALEKLNTKELLSNITKPTGILINLKNEEVFEPKPDRDSLRDGWYKDEMTQSILDVINDWFCKIKPEKIEDIFLMSKEEMRLWTIFYDFDNGYKDISYYEQRFDISLKKDKKYDITKDSNWEEYLVKRFMDFDWRFDNKKNAHTQTNNLLKNILYQGRLWYWTDKTYESQIKSNNYFYDDKWLGNKITSVNDKIGNHLPMKLSYKGDKKYLPLVFDTCKERIVNGQRIAYGDDMDNWLLKNTTLYLKSKAIKIKKIERSSRVVHHSKPVWHYTIYNQVGHDDYYHSHQDSLYYEKERFHADGTRGLDILKKKKLLQLSNKLWGKNKLAISDVISIMEQFPFEVAVTKAESYKQVKSEPIDDFITDILTKEINTTKGKMTVQKFLDTNRKTFSRKVGSAQTKTKNTVYVIKHIYPEIVNDKVFVNNFKDNVIICENDNSTMFGIALCLTVDGYMNKVTWNTSLNQQDILTINKGYSYHSEGIKALDWFPQRIKDKVNKSSLTQCWRETYIRTSMVLALLKLYNDYKPNEFDVLANSICMCSTEQELIKQLLLIEDMECFK